MIKRSFCCLIVNMLKRYNCVVFVKHLHFIAFCRCLLKRTGKGSSLELCEEYTKSRCVMQLASKHSGIQPALVAYFAKNLQLNCFHILFIIDFLSAVSHILLLHKAYKTFLKIYLVYCPNRSFSLHP